MPPKKPKDKKLRKKDSRLCQLLGCDNVAHYNHRGDGGEYLTRTCSDRCADVLDEKGYEGDHMKPPPTTLRIRTGLTPEQLVAEQVTEVNVDQ